MAIPKAKLEPAKKKKTIWHKLKNSAWFILFLVVTVTVGVAYLIILISRLLSEGSL